VILFLDMDNVLADFSASPKLKGDPHKFNPSEMYEQFFFEELPPVKGSLSAVREFLQMGIEVHILSQPVKETHYSYSEKAAWVAKWFPELLGNIHLTQKKEFFAGEGHVLIDDNEKKWRALWEDGGGTFVHFRYYTSEHESHWRYVIGEIKKLFNKGNKLLEVIK
jgi:5'(3')-deoxyribonucleotidase